MTKTILIAVLACTSVLAQPKDQLRQKFGEPLSETFLVRPGITATASYAPNGKVTELVIAPLNTAIVKSRSATLSRDVVDAVLNELVPMSERGKFVIGGFDDINCLGTNDCAGSSADYQYVAIYYNASDKEGRIRYAVVQWKLHNER